MPLTIEQLRRSVEHIQSEADRLLFSWKAEKNLGQTTVDVAGHDVRAALREAILLHSRVLHAFLFRVLVGRPHGGDLFASSFFDSANDWQPVTPAWLESDYARLHKLLAHLTFKRVTILEQGGRGWQIDRLAGLTLTDDTASKLSGLRSAGPCANWASR